MRYIVKVTDYHDQHPLRTQQTNFKDFKDANESYSKHVEEVKEKARRISEARRLAEDHMRITVELVAHETCCKCGENVGKSTVVKNHFSDIVTLRRGRE